MLFVLLFLGSSATPIPTVSTLTTKGDLPVFTTLNTRLGVGADTQVLTADSTQASGMKWAAVPAGGVTSFGAFGNTPSANGATVAGAVATLQPADGTHPGGIASSGSQTLAPNFTFTGTLTLSTGGVAFFAPAGTTLQLNSANTLNFGWLANTTNAFRISSNVNHITFDNLNNQTIFNARTVISAGTQFTDSGVGSITAAGTTQADCTNLTSDKVDVSTVPANSGVCLPPALAGSEFYVHTSGANSLKVYMNAAGGGIINALGSTASVTISNVAGATPGARRITCTSTTQCWTNATLPDTN